VLHLFTDDVRRNPFGLYEQARHASPVFHEPRADLWMVFDYAGVKQALSDPETFSSGAAPSGGGPLDWLIFADPPRHTKLRAIISRAFTPRVVAGMEPRIRQLSRELIDRKVGLGEMDLATDFSIPLPMMVIAEMLGVPAADRPRFRQWGEAVLGLSDTVSGGADQAIQAGKAFTAAKAEARAYLTDLIAKRRAKPQDDLLTRLVEAEVDGERLTHEEILSFFLLLLLAGTETTTNLLNNAILCFIEFPDQLARLRSAPQLMPSAIEEVLRYRSPLQIMFRQTRREVAMHGRLIPTDKLVLVALGSANRDPQQFPEANRFDIGRDPNPHLAFGHGIHFCLGAPLARLEARIALADLLERLPEIRLASDSPWQPRKAFHVHGPTSLPVRFGK
jgi:cytochrome P450